MSSSHYDRHRPYVLANPNAAGFLVEIDSLKATGLTGEALENAIVDHAVKTITMVEGRHAVDRDDR